MLLLIGGMWALSYRQSVNFDKTISAIQISSSSLFGKSEGQIPFNRIQAIRIRQRIYSSATSQVARVKFYMEFELSDGGTFKFEDDDFSDTEAKARRRASELAAFCGVAVTQ